MPGKNDLVHKVNVQGPRKVVYVPRILSLSPWLETLFGWLIDRLGPVLLRRQQ